MSTVAERKSRLVKKITTKTVLEKRVNLNEGEDKRLLFTVAGVARGIMRSNGKNEPHGPWFCLTGEFVAVIPGDTTLVKSPRAFFPEPFAGMLENAVQRLDMGDNSGVEFKCDIFAVRDDSIAVGYRYSVVPAVAPRESDALARLLGDNVQGALPPAQSDKPATPAKAPEKVTATAKK